LKYQIANEVSHKSKRDWLSPIRCYGKFCHFSVKRKVFTVIALRRKALFSSLFPRDFSKLFIRNFCVSCDLTEAIR